MAGEPIADSETRGVKLERLRVRLWLQADMQPPEFEVRSTPNSGHSEAHAGLPVMTQSRHWDSSDNLLFLGLTMIRQRRAPRIQPERGSRHEEIAPY